MKSTESMIAGLNHLTLAVTDLERSFRFYVDVLDFRPVARWSRGAYLAIGNLWLCLSLEDEVSALPPSRDYTHVAFSVEPSKLAEAKKRLADAGATSWKENRSEGESLYFLDLDGHKLELHVGNMESRIAACRIAPYDGMEFFD